MYAHILIGIALDHEDLIARKLDLARAMLSDGGRITLMTVLEDVPGFVAEFVEMKGENHLSARVRERIEAHAPEGVAIEVGKGKPGVVLPTWAEANGVDLIVVGSHHPRATDYFLGSTAARIARRATCSVLIER